jgi:hypothetical protein
MHPDSYACRRGKGTHAAAGRLQALMRRHSHFVQCDVRKFFPSIDHGILKGQFRRLIKDWRVLRLMDLLVDCSNAQEPIYDCFPGDNLFTPLERRRGLPVGNLTSQWFANLYLDRLDHHLTSHLRLGAYVRYCDDFIFLGDDRNRLKDALAEAHGQLAGLRLRLHAERARVTPVSQGARFVGFRVWPTHRLIRKENIQAFRKRVGSMKKAFAAGKLSCRDIKTRLAGWLGHARQANSERLLRRLATEWTFAGGEAANQPCPAWRELEQ